MRNKESQEYIKQISLMKRQINNLKKVRYENQQSLEKTVCMLDRVESERDKRFNEVACLVEKIKDLELENGRLSSQNVRINGKNKSLEKDLNTMPSQLKNAKGRINNLLEELQIEKKVNQRLVVKSNEMKNELKRNTLLSENKRIRASIKKLNLALTFSSLKYYDEKFEILCKRVDYMKKHVDDYNSKINLNEISFSKEKEKDIFGFVTTKNDQIIFISTNGVPFVILESYIDLLKAIEAPVHAIKSEDGTVRVISKFSTEDAFFDGVDGHITITKGKDEFTEEESNRLNRIFNIEFSRKYKVLIIASRFKKYYKEVLRNKNIEVIWHDTFEESNSRLKNLGDYDSIIVCKRHITHSSMKYLDDSMNKVTLLERDTSRLIEATVLFKIRELEKRVYMD